MTEELLFAVPPPLRNRRREEMERKVEALRHRSRQCRELADWALSKEGRNTLGELATDFEREADALLSQAEVLGHH